ncbi:MAG: efflux RND transporter permease subunit, partial [Cyclobacteriaceae bacterium]
MTLSELSVSRPVLATVFAIVIILLGTVGYFSLGVREYPSVDPPIVTVSTTYVGANAEVIESQITEPLEESINQVPGIKNLSSVSTDSRSTITVEFLTDIDLNDAANDVRDKVSQAVRSLPPDTEPPIVRKSDADAQYIYAVAIQSDRRDLLELSRIADKLFKERLETIKGVSSVGIWGDKEYAMRIKLDPVRMRALRVTPLDVRNAV